MFFYIKLLFQISFHFKAIFYVVRITEIIIQQIVTLSKYGHDALDNRYPAVNVASYVGRKSEVRKCRQRDLKMLGCFQCYQFVE